MSLLPEHERYHTLGPKDVGVDGDKKPAMTIDVLRTTNNTGEQLHIQVPIYGDDSRDQLRDRLNFAYSILQERLEDENKAVEWRNKRMEIVRRAAEASKRNAERLQKKLNHLQKLARKSKWGEAKFIEERDKLMAEFNEKDAINTAHYEHAKQELELGKEIPYEGPTAEGGYALADDSEDQEPVDGDDLVAQEETPVEASM